MSVSNIPESYKLITMNHFCFTLLSLFIGISLFSQKQIAGQRMTANLKATIKLGNIRPSDANYKPVKKRKYPNEEEKEESTPKKKKRSPRIEYPAPVETIQPLQQIAGINRSGSATINESPCINYRGLWDSGLTNPPDVSAAVGFDHILIALNDSFRLQNKDGTVMLQQRQQDG